MNRIQEMMEDLFNLHVQGIITTYKNGIDAITARGIHPTYQGLAIHDYWIPYL